MGPQNARFLLHTNFKFSYSIHACTLYELKTILLMKLLYFLFSIHVLIKITFGPQNAMSGTAQCLVDFPYYYFSIAQNSTCHMIPLFKGWHPVVIYAFSYSLTCNLYIACMYLFRGNFHIRT